MVQALHVRFGSTAYDDPMEALAWLRQTSIVGMYKAEFEALSNENHISRNSLAIALQKPIKIDLAFPKPIKIYFPRFKGEEHAAWVCKANRYFNYYKTLDHEKLSMAYFHMDGEALVWCKNAEDIGLYDSWGAFVQELQAKFGSSACDNPVKATIQETHILVSNPMFIGVNQTHVPPNGFVHVIKNVDIDLPCTHAHV